MTEQTQQDPEIVIDGTAYPMPDDSFNGHEWAILKRVADVTAGNLNEAKNDGDIMLIYAMALIAMRRAGQDVSDDDVLSVTSDKISFNGVQADEAEETTEEDPTEADADVSTDVGNDAPAT